MLIVVVCTKVLLVEVLLIEILTIVLLVLSVVVNGGTRGWTEKVIISTEKMFN